MDRSLVAEGLAGCGFFEGMQPEELGKVVDLCSHQEFEAGEHVFHQGGQGLSLYVVCQGQVCLERTRNLGGRKGTVALGVLGRGKAFGGWGTLLGEEHTLRSSAICQKPTKLIALDGPALRAVMLDDQAFGFALLERLCLLLKGRLDDVISAMEKI
jgi:CRP-like cAMP-binding protein